MNQPTQIARAETFRKLHDGSKLLVLPNAWDVASARLYEAAGFSAIATTSAGVAWTLGYPDGEHISRQTMLEAVRRIASRISLLVTADMVAGFGPGPEDTAETVRGVIAAGAVGLNLEDGTGDLQNPLVDVALHVEKIRAARAAATTAGVPIVINARTDVFLAAVGEPDTRLDHAVRRANAYREAGADCLFVPGVQDAETIGRLARSIAGPLNILARAGVPRISELAGLGVARVSVGSGPMLSALGRLRRIAGELLATGTFAAMTEEAISYAAMNDLLKVTFAPETEQPAQTPTSDSARLARG
jgi:2-methylisocitrate lyase-like PEP mutase family enzyme